MTINKKLAAFVAGTGLAATILAGCGGPYELSKSHDDKQTIECNYRGRNYVWRDSDLKLIKDGKKVFLDFTDLITGEKVRLEGAYRDGGIALADRGKCYEVAYPKLRE